VLLDAEAKVEAEVARAEQEALRSRDERVPAAQSAVEGVYAS
jgi:hypothetical protein